MSKEFNAEKSKRLINHFIDLVHKNIDEENELSYILQCGDIDIINECLERQIPMKVKSLKYRADLVCPACDNKVGWMYDKKNYCPSCGQKLDWSKDDE
jgi:endogenous inhibitor of DNA gyrase (YacG/DUF329 family)